MQIQYVSDLHLEFPQNEQSIFDLLKNKDNSDVLIIAGDITTNKRGYFWESFIQYLSNNWPFVLCVNGNHDFYHKEYKAENYNIDNVHFLCNDSVEINGVSFFGTELFTYLPPDKEFFITKRLNDFNYIKNWNPSKQNEVNQLAIEHIRQFTQTSGKKVIITHHAPFMCCRDSNYPPSDIDYAFVNSGIDDILTNVNVDYWVHGHCHNQLERLIDNTMIVRNPIGYVHHNEHLNYKNRYFTI